MYIHIRYALAPPRPHPRLRRPALASRGGRRLRCCHSGTFPSFESDRDRALSAELSEEIGRVNEWLLAVQVWPSDTS